MQLRSDEWKNGRLTPEEEYDEFAFLYEDFWNEGERDLLFRYFSHDLTLNREEYKKASKRSDDLETEALRFGVTSFLPVDELVAEASSLREANENFEALILGKLGCKPRWNAAATTAGPAPAALVYPAHFGAYADLLISYLADEPLSDEAEYVAADFWHESLAIAGGHTLADGFSPSAEYSLQVEAALEDVKRRAAHRVAARNSFSAFLAKNGLVHTPLRRAI
jgi:hypothetical protein